MPQKTFLVRLYGLQQLKDGIENPKFKKQFIRFLISGFSAVGTDTIVYFGFFTLLGNNPAKAISFIAGSIVAFLMNKFYTFEKNSLSLIEVTKFIILYIITLTVNVGTNSDFLKILGENLVWIPFLIAASISTVLNFIGQKFWVFKK